MYHLGVTGIGIWCEVWVFLGYKGSKWCVCKSGGWRSCSPAETRSASFSSSLTRSYNCQFLLLFTTRFFLSSITNHFVQLVSYHFRLLVYPLLLLLLLLLYPLPPPTGYWHATLSMCYIGYLLARCSTLGMRCCQMLSCHCQLYWICSTHPLLLLQWFSSPPI